MASAVMGFMTQFQSDEPMGCYEDFEAGDDFILWGNNMAEMHPVLFSRILANKRENPGVRIVDIGTRRTPTTDYADMYVEFKPNTDLALANGILHLLVANGQVDQAFIRENVVFRRGIEELDRIGYGSWGPDGLGLSPDDGPAEHYTLRRPGPGVESFAEMEEFLADYTPARVSEISGVPVGQIHALAEMYGDQGRGTVSLWCMGVNQHVRGTWMNNLITDLHLITGKISRPGNNPFSLTGQPSACGTAREVGTLSNRLPADLVVNNPEHRAKAEEIWGLEPGTIPERPGYHTMDMFRAFMRGDVRVMWVQTTNPWVSIPNVNRIQREPNDGRFLIVSDIYPTPTTEAADLILPSAGWVEREGMFGNSERRTQHWDKAVEPPGEATEDAWQVIQVAKRMGMGHLFPWPDDDWHEPMFEEYRRFGLGDGKDLASYQQLRETRGMLWPVVDGKETRYRYAAGFDPVCHQEPRGGVLQSPRLRGEGRLLAPSLPSGRRVTGRRVSLLALHRPDPGALAHRLHDPPGEAASSGGAGKLRGDQPGRRDRAERQVRRPGAGCEPTGHAGAEGEGGWEGPASEGFPVHSLLRRGTAGQPPDRGRHVQHQQGTGLQEVRGSGGEGLMRRSGRWSKVPWPMAAALWVTACGQGDWVPVPGSDDAVKSSGAVRAARRLYDGAPPVIPHADLSARPAAACHDTDGISVDGVGFAPASPHDDTGEASATIRCRQCHVAVLTDGLFVRNHIRGTAPGPETW